MPFPNSVSDPAQTLYFLSDVHLGGSPGPQETLKRERLHGLLDRVEQESASLYILGDLFDFWFEYRTVIPRTAFGFLSRLDTLAGSVVVRYLGGNHDFWIAEFLDRETRVEVLADGALLRAQERRIRLFHGDGRGPGDTGYKVLKRILRNRAAIAAFRWVHPDLGIRLALGTSGLSREHTSDHPVDVERIYETVAVPELGGEADAVLMGHHHVPVHLRRESGEMLILGDWFRRYTCVRLRGGEFQLLEWPLD